MAVRRTHDLAKALGRRVVVPPYFIRAHGLGALGSDRSPRSDRPSPRVARERRARQLLSETRQQLVLRCEVGYRAFRDLMREKTA